MAFRGEDDEEGRPTWQLFLVERQPKDGQAPARRGPATDRAPARTSASVARNGDAYRSPRRESEADRQARVADEVASHHGVQNDDDLNDQIPF